jgi:hypothetical protein
MFEEEDHMLEEEEDHIQFQILSSLESKYRKDKNIKQMINVSFCQKINVIIINYISSC